MDHNRLLTVYKTALIVVHSATEMERWMLLKVTLMTWVHSQRASNNQLLEKTISHNHFATFILYLQQAYLQIRISINAFFYEF